MPINSIRRREIQNLLSEGDITTRAWLMAHGIDNHAIDNLLKSKQLVSVAAGVYTRAETKPTWQSVVYFLQKGLKLNLTIGGVTALDLLGYSHYLALSNKKLIELFGTEKTPSWLNKIVPDTTFNWHSQWNLLGYTNPKTKRGPDPLQSFTIGQPWIEGKGELILSTPERALLEVLTNVPKEISFEHADLLMQSMTSLSPRSLQALLEECKNIKVRRLFFWFAERHQHAWLEKLRPQDIDMGAGKRVLVEEGKLDKKYNITIPKDL